MGRVNYHPDQCCGISLPPQTMCYVHANQQWHLVCEFNTVYGSMLTYGSITISAHPIIIIASCDGLPFVEAWRHLR